jgi:PRTRC genetic system ThiF family protein
MLHQVKLQSNNVNGLQILVVGVGGTGSHLLPLLAKYNYHLRSKGTDGFNVIAMDNDIIESKNIGRQNFSPFQVGLPKAQTVIESVNRYYGFNWTAINERATPLTNTNSHIVITCVDNFESRNMIHARFKDAYDSYWIDAGNGFDFGQIIIGYNSRDKKIPSLPSVIDEFPDMKRHADLSIGNGCNDEKQGLFVNTGMAYYLAYCVKRMIDDMYLDFRGIYLNFGNDLNINFIR